MLPSLSVQLTQFCSSLFSCIVSALINKIFIHSFIHSFIHTYVRARFHFPSQLFTVTEKIAAIGPIRHFVRHAHVVWQLPYLPCGHGDSATTRFACILLSQSLSHSIPQQGWTPSHPQCRINANRGPWQLFARGPLLTRDKDLSKLSFAHAVHGHIEHV